MTDNWLLNIILIRIFKDDTHNEIARYTLLVILILFVIFIMKLADKPIKKQNEKVS